MHVVAAARGTKAALPSLAVHCTPVPGDVDGVQDACDCLLLLFPLLENRQTAEVRLKGGLGEQLRGGGPFGGGGVQQVRDDAPEAIAVLGRDWRVLPTYNLHRLCIQYKYARARTLT